MICDNLSISQDGILEFAHRRCDELAERYGTPLYVMDEEKIREHLRKYKNAMQRAFGEKAEIQYASKACDFKAMYRIVKEEGCGVDVVSQGEIFTAKAAGFPMEKVHFHGNCKTDDEIRYALDACVGCFVVDSEEELFALDAIAGSRNLKQNILLRITPGIDPHTFEAVATGLVDSKFGTPIQNGAAMSLIEKALTLEHVCLKGLHCHVGSQVFDEEVFIKCADVMLNLMKTVEIQLGHRLKELNLGGGYGVRYVKSDAVYDVAAVIEKIGYFVKDKCQKLDFEVPMIYMEPGRSIVADAGLTLYRVGSVKRIPEVKNYVAVDGGMTDNPRYALYRAPYTVLCANRMHEPVEFECSVVGKCCESGDILQERVLLPKSVQRSDLIAVLTTGAYNYSMASNYNRITRPAVVLLQKEGEVLAVKRESLENLIQNEL